MSTMSNLCPNCGSQLVFDDKDSSVVCFACDSTVNVADLISNKKNASSNVAVGGAAMPMIVGFDNPESGVVYVENFFDNFDWDDYQMSPEIDVEELEEVVHNNKLKNGAVPTAWYLDYKALAIPVRKKIEGLQTLADAVGAAYNPEDNTEALGAYDLYCTVCNALIYNKEDIFKRLENAIKYATRFSLEKERLSEMEKDFADLKALFEKNVIYAKDVYEVPSYAAAQNANDQQKRDELLARGIDADAVYEKAVAAYNAGSNKKEALALFESIVGYKDSFKYIFSINQYFVFNDEMYRFCGKYFVFKEEAREQQALNMKKVGKKNAPTEEASTVKTIALHEVVDGKPAEKPLVKGIARMISCYGSRIYYFKDKQGICSFDIYNQTETVVNAGKIKDYLCNKVYVYDVIDGGKKFYVQRLPGKDDPAAPGCGGSVKQAKQAAKEAPAAPTNNNIYTLVVIDMENNTSKTLISGYAEIVKTDETHIYYKWEKDVETVVKPASGSGCGATPGKSIKSREVTISVCDVKNDFTKPLFDDEHLIKYANGNTVIYTKLQPNDLNQNLYAYDLATGNSTLIEANVYEYFGIIDDKVYYLVGNEDYCPLVRNSFDGQAREEIMRNVEKIIGTIGGWLYIQKGFNGSYNSTLVKMRADGKKSVVLCTQFKRIAKFYGNILYYVDTNNTLRSVRIDGRNNKRIAENVYGVFPTENYLYYTREEEVADKKVAYSLYKMDKDGRNVRKIVFNIAAYRNDAISDSLYFKCNEEIVFKCYAPGKEKEATFNTFVLSKFYELNKETEEVKHVLTLNYPTAKSVPAGCGGGKTAPDKIYKEVGPKLAFIKKQKAIEAASNSDGQSTPTASAATGCGAPVASNAAAANKAPTKANTQGCGCGAPKK